MKVSDYIVEFLISKNITDVFGYPGGMIAHLMDSFSKYEGQIKAHVNYHEQASAFAACGYAQVSHKPGVAFTSSGPGATNLITGIANAYYDSTPCIFITGQVNNYESKGDLLVRQKGFQETDIIPMVKPVTKYAKQINDADDLCFELEKAYKICLEGRPGPVVLDIPMNIQRQEIDAQFFNTKSDDSEKNNFEKYEVVFEELNNAKRPCLLVGAGIKNSGLVEEFRELAKTLNIPVVSSMLAVDVMAENSNNYYGFVGAYGHRAANFIVNKCDLLITIGSRLDCRQTGVALEKFAPNAKLIRIDADANEMTNKIKSDEVQIVDKVSTHTFKYLNSQIETKITSSFSQWQTICNELNETLKNYDKSEPTDIIRTVSNYAPDDIVITTDVGQNQVWIPQAFEFKNNQRVLFSGGHGAMGYSLPASIGAHYGSGKTVFSFNGDGGFQMNMQELQFIAREKLPIKIIILNNESLGMIRHFQEMYFESNFTQTTINNGYSAPEFEKIANAYNLPYFKIQNAENIKSDMFTDNKPCIIEIALSDRTYLLPKLSMGRPCQDQDPLIDRELYGHLMEI